MIIQDKDFNFIWVGDNKIPEMTDKKFVVVLDFDGVITSHSKLKTQFINELGYNIKEEECGYDACVRHGNVNEEDYIKARFKAQTQAPGVLLLSDNFLENFEKLRQLKNITIFILTSRYESMLEHLENYMKHYNIKVDGIVNTSGGSKLETLKKMNAKVFVEDSPYKLSKIFSELREDKFLDKCQFILFRTKENSPEPSPNKRIIETDNWGELFAIIKREHEKFLKNIS